MGAFFLLLYFFQRLFNFHIGCLAFQRRGLLFHFLVSFHFSDSLMFIYKKV